MNIFREEFGKRLRAQRKEKGLKQHDVARAAGGVDPSAVSNWENGKDFPEDFRLDGICKLLEVEASYFTNPTIEVKQDPLPEWASKIADRLQDLEEQLESRNIPVYELEPQDVLMIKSLQKKYIDDKTKAAGDLKLGRYFGDNTNIASIIPDEVFHFWNKRGSTSQTLCLYILTRKNQYLKILPPVLARSLASLLRLVDRNDPTKKPSR